MVFGLGVNITMAKKNKLEIVCLPVAGEADPTQLLMIEGLNENENIHAFNGVNDRFFGIIRSAIKYRPDFIHFDWIESYYIRRNTIFSYLNLPSFFLQIFICKYLLRIKLAWTIHNILPHDRSNIRFKQFVLRSFGQVVNFIRVLSPESVEYFVSKFNVSKEKVYFIGFGDYINYYPNDISKADARKLLGIPENIKVLLTLGSIKKYKGIPGYLRKMQEIKNDDILIIIAGKCIDPNLEMEIRAIKDDRIQFINSFINREDLQNYYNAADLIILPFLDIENSGSVVMAMGFKKAIVAPRSNVLNDRLKFQKELLFTPETFTTIVDYAIKTPSEVLYGYGENNYKQLKEYSWANFGSLFLWFKNKNGPNAGNQN